MVNSKRSHLVCTSYIMRWHSLFVWFSFFSVSVISSFDVLNIEYRRSLLLYYPVGFHSGFGHFVVYFLLICLTMDIGLSMAMVSSNVFEAN